MKVKIVFSLVVSLAAFGHAAGDVTWHGAYREYRPGAIRPLGHLKEFLERERDGLLGHRERLGYPFDGELWKEPFKNIHFTEGVYNGADEDVSGRGDWWNSGAWWPYEQSAYLVDGMARVANLVDAPAFDEEVRRNVKNAIARATPEGDLFKNYLKSDTQWPLVVFFRAAMAYADKTGDKSVYQAFARHFAANKESRLKWNGRSRLAIEGMLRCAAETGDMSLVEDAVRMYKNKGEHYVKSARIVDHGVSFSEDLKLPALLYLYTGDSVCLANGKTGVRKAFELNEQPSGLISCNEFLSGTDPRQGHEACVSADMLWSLGYYLQADGDIYAADRMEHIAYNALPGHITKDFHLHQYLSTVNQISPGPFGNNSHFNYAESAWRQYRPAHFPQCCTANITRALPAFVSRMWMEDVATGAPAAMLFGPSLLTGEYKGVKFTITEETDYPFSDEVRFTLTSGTPLELPFKWRVPGWVKDGGIWKSATLTSGKTLTVRLPSEVRLNRDRHWCWFTKGALTLSHAPAETVTHEKADDDFSPVRVETTGAWNFGVDEKLLENASFEVTHRAVAFPFETPAFSVKVPVVEIKEWQTLEQERFMPDVPLYPHPTGRKTTLELVPYATTLSRITAFPNVKRRLPCPVVAAYTTGEVYPYNYWNGGDFYSKTNECLNWTARDFAGKYKVPQRTPEIFFDLGWYYRTNEHAKPNTGHYSYLLFRVWSDEDAADATWCLGAANLWQAFVDGKEVARSVGCTEGMMMAPVWFKHPVKKGYNYLLVKIGKMCWWGQYRDEWGAKLDVFIGK